MSDWAVLAVCREVEDRSIFFPQRGESIEPACEYCDRCPVRAHCLQEALDDPQTVGVWGGTSGRQRQRLRRERNSTPQIAA